MELASRKIDFIRKFLKLTSEEAISEFEDLLKKQLEVDFSDAVKPFSEEQLIERTLRSEADFSAGKFKTSEELMKKYK
jgi:hypothetical protein